MRLIAFKDETGRTALGARVGDALLDLTLAGLPDTLDALLKQGDAGLAAARAAIARNAHVRSFAGITDACAEGRAPSFVLKCDESHRLLSFCLSLNY